ncbi:MAG: hypothetical protein DMF68_03570 [Acidobacteria bacterium]|nr:MAG: hypothetical protein DMF68_03570 [Acidobacteriota bacterium]
MSTVKDHRSKSLCILFIALFLTLHIIAQTITGSISGTVTDASGSVIPGATVTIISEKTNESRNINTNSEGRFNFAALQPGAYTVKIEREGFQTLERTNTILSANEDLALGELKLQAGQVSGSVTVTSEGQVVERESSDLTARLTSDQINLISTKGRDITSLLRLIPGTSNDDDVEAVGEGFGTNLPNISGQRGRSIVTTIDGLNASEPSGSNKISMTINQDAVGEVKVLRNNYAAEYGNNGGAMINIVSKGGGKDYRGTLYYFLRNEALNATPFFTNKAGLPKPLYRHLYPGGNFGGPLPLPRFGEGDSGLVKNKAFFFVSIEKPHTITPTDPVFVTMPTALERAGNFSQSVDSSGKLVSIIDPLTGKQFPGNIIPAVGSPGCGVTTSCINRSGQALLNYFPLPNSLGGRTLAGAAFNYVNQKSVDVPKHSYVIRFDVKPSNKDTIYWKGQWWTSDNVGLGTSGWPGGDANRWGINSHYLYVDNGWSGNWVHILSPRLVNEFNIGMRHDTEGFIPADGIVEGLLRSTVGYTAPQLFPQNNHLGTIPRATGWSGVAGTPANINWLDRWGEAGQDYIRPSFADNLSFTRGNHSYKFGAYFERLLNSEAPGGQWSGVFDFGNNSSFTTSLGATNYPYANALLGDFRTYSESSARPFTNLVIKTLQWYGQDEWKMTRKLTVNYGMRFVYASPFYQRDGQGSNFDPSLYSSANAPLLYLPVCVSGTSIVAPTAAACATANRRAIDPRFPTVFLTNTNLVGTFVPGTGSLTDGLAVGTDPNTPKGYRVTNPISFEPRLGFAWAYNNKTVLRLMAGIYHSPRVGGGTTGGNLVNNPPANRSFAVGPCAGCTIDNLANVIGGALNSPPGLNAVEVNSKITTIYNFSVGFQRDIGFKTIVEASYVGSLARHLGERRNINQVPDLAHFIDLNPSAGNCAVTTPGCFRNPFSATSVNGPHTLGVLADNFLRPYRGYGDINEVTWSGTSNYNALQVQVNRRYTSHFQFGLAYTYSKTFDYANDDSADVNNGRPYKAFNYGPADFDQTHILTVNYIYDIPNPGRRWDNRFARGIFNGWQISGTTSFATGKPKVFGSGTGLNWTYAGTGSATNITDFTGGDINARPVLICDPNRRPGTLAPDGSPYLIDVSCFAKPGTPGSIGGLQRNLIRLPSIYNTDVALFKNFKWGENRGLQFRWETYNLFNHTNYTDINGAMSFDANGNQTTTTFGTARAARSPRVMQVSLRLNF